MTTKKYLLGILFFIVVAILLRKSGISIEEKTFGYILIGVCACTIAGLLFCFLLHLVMKVPTLSKSEKKSCRVMQRLVVIVLFLFFLSQSFLGEEKTNRIMATFRTVTETKTIHTLVEKTYDDPSHLPQLANEVLAA